MNSFRQPFIQHINIKYLAFILLISLSCTTAPSPLLLLPSPTQPIIEASTPDIPIPQILPSPTKYIDMRSWEMISSVNGMIWRLVIDPVTPTTLYMTILDKGIYKSIDSGITWNSVIQGIRFDAFGKPIGQPNLNLAISYGAPHLLLAAANNTIYRSTDGAESWNPTIGMPGKSSVEFIAFAKDNPSIAYAATYADGVYKSIDDGQQWSPINNGLKNDLSNIPIIRTVGIDPTNSNIVYVGGEFGVYGSLDGGENWNDKNSGYMNFTQGRIYQVRIFFFDPINPHLLYMGMDFFGLIKTEDEGSKWYMTNFPAYTNYPLSPIEIVFDPFNPQTLYAATYGAGVFITINSGQDWYPINSGFSNLNITGLVIDYGNPKTLYAATDNGEIFLLK
jgi:photosystem II stability/assembly factor-like uncharacterized protein